MNLNICGLDILQSTFSTEDGGMDKAIDLSGLQAATFLNKVSNQLDHEVISDKVSICEKRLKLRR